MHYVRNNNNNDNNNNNLIYIRTIVRKPIVRVAAESNHIGVSGKYLYISNGCNGRIFGGSTLP